MKLLAGSVNLPWLSSKYCMGSRGIKFYGFRFGDEDARKAGIINGGGGPIFG